MLFDSKFPDCLDRLTERVRLASAPDSDLFADLIIEAFPALKRTGRTALIDRLIEAGAWTDAVLAVVEIALPAWTLRRLVREDGEWFCSLSRLPNLPAELDDSADASHAMLPLAILSAAAEASRKAGAARPTSTPAVRQTRPTSRALCCDSFA